MLGKVHMEKLCSCKVTYQGLHLAFHHVLYPHVPACKTCVSLGIDCFSGAKSHLSVQHIPCFVQGPHLRAMHSKMGGHVLGKQL